MTSPLSAYGPAIAAPVDVAVVLVDVVVPDPNVTERVGSDIVGAGKVTEGSVGAVSVGPVSVGRAIVGRVSVGMASEGMVTVMVGSVTPTGGEALLVDWACAPATKARMRVVAIFMVIIGKYHKVKSPCNRLSSKHEISVWACV